MTVQKFQVIFQPSGRRGAVDVGTSVKEASLALGVDIEGGCGLTGTCGKCLVKIAEGVYDKYGIESKLDHLSPPNDSETHFISPEELHNGCRLACQARITGDIVVFVPEESRLEKQVVRKSAGIVNTRLNPAVKVYCLELDEPSLEDTEPDWERLQKKLKTDCGLTGLTVDAAVLRSLPDVLRDSDWKVSVFVWNNQEVIRIVPGRTGSYYGLAVDIGTTTVAGYLCDLSTGNLIATVSMMNPQVVYGEDVMSRISYSMGNRDGLDTLNSSIIEGLNNLIRSACSVVNTSAENIVDMTIVGNTCMHHILLGMNPQYIGKVPFIPAVKHSLDVKARDIGILISSGSNIHILPVEAGFVGADNVAVLLASGIYHRAGSDLIIDIGTNGELVLLSGNRMVSCSCATGPAFEGAEIKFGMRAVNGAIEKIRIYEKTGEVTFKVIGTDAWSSQTDIRNAKGICGSAIIDIVPQLFLAGIIDKTGRFMENLTSLRYRLNQGMPEYVIAWKDQTSIGRDITVCQADVRAIQLAKAAMYAGAKAMMKKIGVDSIDSVKLAGAFGSYIDRESAALLGLFPDCNINNVTSIGNAAGDGARLALLNVEKRKEASSVSRKVEYLELTKLPEFERLFAEAMWIPHMKDKFTSLSDIGLNRKTVTP